MRGILAGMVLFIVAGALIASEHFFLGGLAVVVASLMYYLCWE